MCRSSKTTASLTFHHREHIPVFIIPVTTPYYTGFLIYPIYAIVRIPYFLPVFQMCATMHIKKKTLYIFYIYITPNFKH